MKGQPIIRFGSTGRLTLARASIWRAIGRRPPPLPLPPIGLGGGVDNRRVGPRAAGWSGGIRQKAETGKGGGGRRGKRKAESRKQKLCATRAGEGADLGASANFANGKNERNGGRWRRNRSRLIPGPAGWCSRWPKNPPWGVELDVVGRAEDEAAALAKGAEAGENLAAHVRRFRQRLRERLRQRVRQRFRQRLPTKVLGDYSRVGARTFLSAERGRSPEADKNVRAPMRRLVSRRPEQLRFLGAREIKGGCAGWGFSVT